MKDPEQNRVSQNEEESSTRSDNKPSLSSRIATFWAIVKSIDPKALVKTFGYSGGFVLALLVGYEISFSASAPFPMQIVLLMASLWASSLPFFYFYCRLFNAGSECSLKPKERRDHLTILVILSLLLMLIFFAVRAAAFDDLSWSWHLLCCEGIYLFFAIGLMYCSDEQDVRFQLVLPVLAATAIPFCLGKCLAEVEPPSLSSPSLLSIVALGVYIFAMLVISGRNEKKCFVVVSLLLIVPIALVALVELPSPLSIAVLIVYIIAYIIVVCVLSGKSDKWRFAGVSLLLIVPVASGTVFSQYAPSLVGEMSAILFISILIAAISAVFESWRIAEREEKKRDDYFLSSSLALAVAVFSFPLIFLAEGFSNAVYYLGPVVLLGCMAMWCVCFERWNGKWKWIKTVAGFLFLFALFCDLRYMGARNPVDTTLLYSPESLEPLAMAIALFGLYWSQVIGSINEAKHKEPSLMRKTWRVFLRNRVNYFRCIGCLSSITFSVLYVLQNFLGVDAVGTIDAFNLMGPYMFLALVCIVFDFALVFFVSENTLKGV